MQCRFCGCSELVKNGIVRGHQRFLCKGCKRNQIGEPKDRAYPAETRLRALVLFREGMGFRAIGRVLDVSYMSIANWVKQAGETIKQAIIRSPVSELKDIDIVEIDEIWHYTQKNGANYGYGLLLLADPENCLPLKWALVVKRR